MSEYHGPVPLGPSVFERRLGARVGGEARISGCKRQHSERTYSAINGQAVGARVRYVLRNLGIQARPHDLRHSFGTEAAKLSNGNVLLVAQVMGHSAMQTTQRYMGWRLEGAGVVASLYGETA